MYFIWIEDKSTPLAALWRIEFCLRGQNAIDIEGAAFGHV